MSNLSLSQTTNTQNTNGKYLNDTQIAEVYRGLKQGEFLKIKLKKTEEVLDNANNLITQQKQNINKLTEISQTKDEVINNLQFQIDNNKEISEAQKEQLNNTIALMTLEYKKEKRKRFWNGVKIGGISVAVLGAGAIYFLTK